MSISKKIARVKKQAEKEQKTAIKNRQMAMAKTLAEQIVMKEHEEARRLYRKEQAQMELSMLNQTMAMFLYILHDKHGYGKKRLVELYEEVVALAAAMEEMRTSKDSDPVTIYSILDVLCDECNIKINPPNTPLPVIMGGKSLGENSFGEITWGDEVA